MTNRQRGRVRAEIENQGYVEYDITGPMEHFGDHVVPRELDVTFLYDSETPSVKMRLQIEDGAATCRELHVVAKEGQRGVLASDLRSVRLNEWIEDMFKVVVRRRSVEERPRPGMSPYYLVTFSEPDLRITADVMRNARRRGAHRKLTDSFLAEVAAVHQRAGRAPTQAVADHFGKSHRTASLYIARARERGLLKKET